MSDQAHIDSLFGSRVTRSPEETFELGRKIGESITGGSIVLISGDLGAGKTLLTKGLAEGMGIDAEDVTSPSFTLVNIHEGRLRLYHVDLYRLDHGACRELGLEEMFEDDSGVTVIEWAERLGFAPLGAIEIEIEYLSENERKILIRQKAKGKRQKQN
ncbi:MAG TPA: tRNA (adenosine(37)-N6)-threonylcarbamoyltransferase complex ATPase subunit type 1 TsaE [Blastocatellia bacterium]